VHNVSQWPNLRHLTEPLGGAVAVMFLLSSVNSVWSRCYCQAVVPVLTFYTLLTFLGLQY